MSIPEDRLIQRAQCLDKEALAILYDSYYSAIFRYVYFRLRDQSMAEDLASEVFVRMVDGIESYENRGKPILAWLYTIAHNLVVDNFYSKTKESTYEVEEAYPYSDPQQPTQVVEHHQALDCLQKAMLNLTQDQRQFILLRFFEQYSISEVATMMGKNERAVRSLQHRALASLSRALEKEGCYGA